MLRKLRTMPKPRSKHLSSTHLISTIQRMIMCVLSAQTFDVGKSIAVALEHLLAGGTCCSRRIICKPIVLSS